MTERLPAHLEYIAALAERASGIEGLAGDLGASELRNLELQRELAEKRQAAADHARGAAARGVKAPVGKDAPIPTKRSQRRIVRELWDQLVRQRRAPRSMVARPPGVPWGVRSECLTIARDGSGRTAVRFACQLPARQRSLLMGLVGQWGGFASRMGRRLVACAWATWRLARDVVGGRGQRWGGGKVVDGFARKVWCLLCVDADGSIPSLSTLWGTHCGSSKRPGPMTLLRRAGLWTRIQPPASVARFVGPSGWAVGQMWFGRTNCGRKPRPPDEAARHGAELLELLELLKPT